MAKKPLPTVVCWECKKSFKGEPACQDHASAKHHQWRSPTGGAPPTALATGKTSYSPQIPAYVPGSSKARNWTCARCGECFGAEFSFDLHYKTMHRNPNNVSLVADPIIGSFRCSVCDAAFLAETSLISHQQSKNTCSPCNLHLSSKKALKKHLETYHIPEGSRNTTTTFNSTSGTTSQSGSIEEMIEPWRKAVLEPALSTSHAIAQPSIPGALAATPIAFEDTLGGGLRDVEQRAVSVHVNPLTPSQATVAEPPTPSSVSSVSIFSEGKTTRGPVDSDEFDDIASVVSYASMVEVSQELVPCTSNTGENPELSSVEHLLALVGKQYSAEVAHHVRQILEGPASQESDGQTGGAFHRDGVPHSPLPERERSPPLATPPSPFTDISYFKGEYDFGSVSVKAPVGRKPMLTVEVQEAPTPTTPLVYRDATPTGAGVSAPQDVAQNMIVSVSYHCRACKKDPCDIPVATICGHIFCQRCLCQELATNGCCPACKKVFLLRLDLTV